MDNLIAELFDEYKRVEALHTEVHRTYEQQSKQLYDLRKEKAKHIYDYLYEIWSFLKKSNLTKTKQGKWYSVFVTSKLDSSGYSKSYDIVFTDRDIYVGVCNFICCTQTQKLISVVNGATPYNETKIVIDAWQDHHEKRIAEEVAKYAKERLKEIIEKDTEKLNEINNTIQKYEQL